MAAYRLTNKAVDDLNQIWEYAIYKWPEKQADNYYNLLFESCQNIADNPSLEKNYDGIRPELLGLKTNRHIIFYRKISDEDVEITRILHERIDLKNRLNE